MNNAERVDVGTVKHYWHAVFALFCCSMAGCGDDPVAGRETFAVMGMPSPGVYEATLPCTNCPGIDVTLWLRQDGIFLFRQIYLDDDELDGQRVYSLGRWRWDHATAQLMLDVPGPKRTFKVIGEDHLELQTTSASGHTLARKPMTASIPDSFLLEGEFTIEGKEPFFTECRTSLSLPIAPRGDYAKLERYYRLLTATGQPVRASVRGRLVEMHGDVGVTETLFIDELIAVRPEEQCVAAQF